MSAPTPPGSSRLLLKTVAYGTGFFLFAPLVIIAIASFNASPYMAFPPEKLSLRWYVSFFTSRQWYQPALFSLQIAAVVSVLATGIDADFTAALNEQAYVTSVAEHARNGQRLLQIGVDNGDKRLPDLLQLAFARGVHVQEISVTRPSLGDVFLAYTGRALRD